MYRSFFKRLIDIMVAFMFLVILFPVMVLVMILLFFINKGFPFFTQQRVGKNERVFKILKFRTMNTKKDNEGNLLPDSKRLTGFGKVIRKTSLDELPQLFNVLSGDMSIIGPRPLLIRYLPWYTERERKRHHVRPGITGLAQVSGRNLLNWDDKLNKDVEYVENLSLKNDLKILAKTVKHVLLSKDVVVDATSVMVDFNTHRENSSKKELNDPKKYKNV